MMPLLFNESGIMIVVTALNVFGEQNVRTLESVGIPGIALNSEINNVETFKVHNDLILVPICNPSSHTENPSWQISLHCHWT
jgi:hypothetical protein